METTTTEFVKFVNGERVDEHVGEEVMAKVIEVRSSRVDMCMVSHLNHDDPVNDFDMFDVVEVIVTCRNGTKWRYTTVDDMAVTERLA